MKTSMIVTTAIGGCLILAAPAIAQRGYGYGYPFGGYGSPYGGYGYPYAGHGYPFGAYGSPYAGSGYGPGVGIGFGVGRSGFYPYGGAWYGSGGGYYPGMNPSGGYTYPYISPRFEYGYGSYPRRGYSDYNLYVPRAYIVAPSTSSIPPDRARLHITLPTADAELSFSGTKDPMRGTVRIFEPAPLEPGHKYWYKLEASWSQNGTPVAEVREVYIIPGKLAVVDFTKPAPGEEMPEAK